MAFLARSSRHVLGAATRIAQHVSRILGRPNHFAWLVRPKRSGIRAEGQTRCWGPAYFCLTVVLVLGW